LRTIKLLKTIQHNTLYNVFSTIRLKGFRIPFCGRAFSLKRLIWKQETVTRKTRGASSMEPAQPLSKISTETVSTGVTQERTVR
jgi:hypothetical protein